MINDAEAVFPYNAIELMCISLAAIDPDFEIIKRPLRPTDPNLSIGVAAALWTPNEESYEMGHTPVNEPTLSSYQTTVQCLVKDGDEERGLVTHSIMARRVRSVLYRNTNLRVALGSLVVIDSDYKERITKWGVRNQRFMNNDIEGKFIFVSTLDYWLETETV